MSGEPLSGPVGKAFFAPRDVADLAWARLNGNRPLWDLLLAEGAKFPSLCLAFAARSSLDAVAQKLGEELVREGLNVFLPSEAVPICALSQALGQRNMPIGLYLDEVEDGRLSLLALGNHGGPVDRQDLPEVAPSKLGRRGVIGVTELLDPYLENLKSLVDPHPGKGLRLSRLETPFPKLEERWKEDPRLQLLAARDPKGPVATVSPDGQELRLENPDGRKIPTAEVVQTIGQYLIGTRSASGTVLGPDGARPNLPGAEFVGVPGDALDLHYQARFVDLLLAWREPGVIAHQGHSPFGDAFLTILYWLEAVMEPA